MSLINLRQRKESLQMHIRTLKSDIGNSRMLQTQIQNHLDAIEEHQSKIDAITHRMENAPDMLSQALEELRDLNLTIEHHSEIERLKKLTAELEKAVKTAEKVNA